MADAPHRKQLERPPTGHSSVETTAEGPLLEIDHVDKDYGDRVLTRVLRGVDFTLGRGEMVALTGPSGSGKSTLLNLIGLLDRPTRGRVLLESVDTTVLSEDAQTELRGRALGFVFQFHHLLPAFTALENVLLPSWGRFGRPSHEIRERAEGLLAEVGLADRSGYLATELSGGQQQRVAIARALVHRPPLVLADEPTGNLDSESSEDVFRLMRRFHEQLGTTFLVVTHDPRIAARCDRRIELVDGRLVKDEVGTSTPDPAQGAGVLSGARDEPPQEAGAAPLGASISPRRNT